MTSQEVTLTNVSDESDNDAKVDIKDCRDHQKQQGRRLRFGSITIRRYDRTIGDNPMCSKGIPISLDWTYQEESELPVEDYEMSKFSDSFSSSSSASFQNQKRPTATTTTATTGALSSSTTSTSTSSQSPPTKSIMDCYLTKYQRYHLLAAAGISAKEMKQAKKAVKITQRQRQFTNMWHSMLQSFILSWRGSHNC